MNASPYATLMRVPMRTMSRQTRYALEASTTFSCTR